MHRVLAATVLLGSLLSPPASRAEPFVATTTRDALGPALELWVSPASAPSTVTIRLEADVGTAAEGTEHVGATAALLAILVHAPARHPQAPSPREVEAHAGLALTADLAPDHLAVTVTGAPEALEPALWAAAERLAVATPTAATASAARAGLWVGAETARHAAINALGDALDNARAALAPTLGAAPAPFTSRVLAARLPDEGFAARAAWARQHARWRLVVVVPAPLAARSRERALAALRTVPPLPPPTPLPSPAPADVPWRAPPQNLDDGRHFVLAAWPLRLSAGPPREQRAREAALLTLEAVLAQPGGLLAEQLVRGHSVARSVEAALTFEPTPSLAVAAVLRGTDPADLRRLLVDEVERLAHEPVAENRVRGAARLVAHQLALAWRRSPERARLIGTLARTGRLAPGEPPESWLAALERALVATGPEAVRSAFAEAALGEGRVAFDVAPRNPAPEDRIALDDVQLDRYLRILVDLRCPAGERPDLVAHLQRKYGLTARDYVLVSRAISRRADLVRRLGREADERCLEIAKLRSLADLRTVVRLHEALACGPGREPDPTRRDRQVAAVFRRFDLDESVYRPLIELAREDPDAAARLDAIDARCTPDHGPAAPHEPHVR